MESIQCDCPQCGRICGFKSGYAGRIAHCLNCQARFVIPATTGQPARWLKPPPPVAPKGFYAGALKESLNAFAHPESRTGIVFCAALVVFHFLLGNEDYSFTLPGFRPPLLIGWGVTLVTFGCFAWYSLENIASARIDVDALPMVEPGEGLEFGWTVIKSCYLFFVTLVVALLPASFISAWFEYFQVSLGRLYYLIAALCLLLWPMNLSLIALEEPMWRIFRYDLIFTAIVRTFKPYMFTTVILLAAFNVVLLGLGVFATDEELSPRAAAGVLALRLVGAAVFLCAMRVVGTYCRYYCDVCPELWTTTPPQRPGSN